MDQDAFRKTYQEVNGRFCAFEKGVLTNQCECQLAERFCIAEREGVHCKEEGAQARCLELLQVLREQARFALKTADDRGVLPHGKAIRVQIGGLRGLHLALEPEQDPPALVPDVYGIINQAVQTFGSMGELPFPVIMQQIAAYQGRTRSGRRR